MENRYYYDEFAEDIFDSQIDDYPANFTICEELNDQNNRIKELEQQLEEKDKEIKCIRELFEAYKKQCHQFLENELEIRKQICNEIREFIAKDLCGCSIEEWTHKIGWNEDLINVFNKLDQIEKGENNGQT